MKDKSLKKKLYIGAIEKRILRRAAGLVALTAAEKAQFEILAPRTPTRIIPNGIYPETWRTEPVADRFAGVIPSGSPVVLFMSRLHPIKGVDIVLEAFKRISRLNPVVHFVIAGPPEEYKIDELRDGIPEDCRSRIHFTGMIGGEAKKDSPRRSSAVSSG